MVQIRDLHTIGCAIRKSEGAIAEPTHQAILVSGFFELIKGASLGARQMLVLYKFNNNFHGKSFIISLHLDLWQEKVCAVGTPSHSAYPRPAMKDARFRWRRIASVAKSKFVGKQSTIQFDRALQQICNPSLSFFIYPILFLLLLVGFREYSEEGDSYGTNKRCLVCCWPKSFARHHSSEVYLCLFQWFTASFLSRLCNYRVFSGYKLLRKTEIALLNLVDWGLFISRSRLLWRTITIKLVFVTLARPEMWGHRHLSRGVNIDRDQGDLTVGTKEIFKLDTIIEIEFPIFVGGFFLREGTHFRPFGHNDFLLRPAIRDVRSKTTDFYPVRAEYSKEPNKSLWGVNRCVVY